MALLAAPDPRPIFNAILRTFGPYAVSRVFSARRCCTARRDCTALCEPSVFCRVTAAGRQTVEELLAEAEAGGPPAVFYASMYAGPRGARNAGVLHTAVQFCIRPCGIGGRKRPGRTHTDRAVSEKTRSDAGRVGQGLGRRRPSPAGFFLPGRGQREAQQNTVRPSGAGTGRRAVVGPSRAQRWGVRVQGCCASRAGSAAAAAAVRHKPFAATVPPLLQV
eukprot:SAG11_NODE_1813_length_4218_cov_6.359553_4_plen_220_part_00